MIASDH